MYRTSSGLLDSGVVCQDAPADTPPTKKLKLFANYLHTRPTTTTDTAATQLRKDLEMDCGYDATDSSCCLPFWQKNNLTLHLLF